MGLSSFASKPVEEVVAANPQTFCQTYWCGTRDQLGPSPGRAHAAGAVGLIVTLDWSFSNGRDWGSPIIPERVDLKTVVRLAPDACPPPRWLLACTQTGQGSRPHGAEHGGQDAAADGFGAYNRPWMQSPLPTWDDVAGGCASSGTGRSCSRA